jgi:hypothetical protein
MVAKENGLAMVSSLGNMVGPAGQNHSSDSRHQPRCFANALIISEDLGVLVTVPDLVQIRGNLGVSVTVPELGGEVA